MQGLNQRSTPWYENPWFGQTQSVFALKKANNHCGASTKSYGTFLFVS
jgi:hypothetical protein